MSRARKKTAHRPSQSHMEFVKNSHGETVRNTAYEPDKNNNSHSSGTTNINSIRSDIASGDTSQSNSEDITQRLSRGMYQDEVDEFVDVTLDKINFSVQKIDSRETLTSDDIQDFGDLQAVMQAYESSHTMSSPGRNIYDNTEAISNTLDDCGYKVKCYRKDRTTNHNNWLPDLQETRVTIDSNDPDMPTEFFCKKDNNENYLSVDMKFGNRTGVGITRYYRDSNREEIEQITPSGNKEHNIFTDDGFFVSKNIEYSDNSEKQSEHISKDALEGEFKKTVINKDGTGTYEYSNDYGDKKYGVRNPDTGEFNIIEQTIAGYVIRPWRDKKVHYIELNDPKYFSGNADKLEFISQKFPSKYEAGNDVTYGYHDDGTMKGTWVDEEGRHRSVTYDVVERVVDPVKNSKSYRLEPVSATVDGKEDTEFTEKYAEILKEEEEMQRRLGVE